MIPCDSYLFYLKSLSLFVQHCLEGCVLSHTSYGIYPCVWFISISLMLLKFISCLNRHPSCCLSYVILQLLCLSTHWVTIRFFYVSWVFGTMSWGTSCLWRTESQSSSGCANIETENSCKFSFLVCSHLCLFVVIFHNKNTNMYVWMPHCGLDVHSLIITGTDQTFV